MHPPEVLSNSGRQGLHSVAFTGGLGKPLVAPPGVAARLTPPVLADFVAQNYGAQRMVLAGAYLAG